MRLLGILFGLAALSCGGGPASPAASPTPAPATPTPQPPAGVGWVEQLTFSGDLSGLLNQVLSPDASTRSECTGKNSRNGGAWSSSIYGPLGKDVYGLVVVAGSYRGPGAYSQPQVSVQVHKVGDNTAVWQSVADDPVKFVVNNDEESGTLDATLNNLSSVAANKPSLKVSGSWSCKT